MKKCNKKIHTLGCRAKALLQAGAAYIMIGNFLTKFVSFFASIFLVQVLSKTDYGILGYIENYAGYLYIILGFGLGYSILRYVVLGRSMEEKYGYYCYAVRKGSVISLSVVLLAIVVCLIYPFPEDFKAARYLLPILLLSLPFHFLVDCQTFTLRALFQNKVFAIVSLAVAVTLIYAKLVFAWLEGLEGAVISQVVVYAIAALFLFVYIGRVYFLKITPQKLEKAKRKEIDTYSFQYMITNGVWSMFMLNDVFLLGLLLGDPAIVANYKVAYVIPANLTILCSSIGVFVAPYFIKNEKNFRWVWKNYKKVLFVSMAIMGTACIVLGIFSEGIIGFLYGDQYREVADMMRLLLVAQFINSAIRYTTANLLAAMGNIRVNMAVSILGVILQVGINLFAIPAFGVIGLVVTSICVYSIMAAVLVGAFIKTYKLPEMFSG